MNDELMIVLHVPRCPSDEKAWRWRGIEALDRLETACVKEDPDMRPTADEIVAALQRGRGRGGGRGGSWGRGLAADDGRGSGGSGGSGGGGGEGTFLNLCCNENVEEENMDGDGANYGGGSNGGGSNGGAGLSPAVSLSRLKVLVRRVVQTAQYAFLGTVLRPGWGARIGAAHLNPKSRNRRMLASLTRCTCSLARL